VRHIGVEERRARLGIRHRLAPSARAATPEAVAESLVALHGTDPASVFLAALARMREPSIQAIEDALYERRSLVRMLGMRRTMFVVPAEVAPVVQAACTREIAVKQRRLFVDLFGGAGFSDDVGSWLADVEASTLRALVARGEATAAQLADDEPRLRQRVLLAQGKAYEAEQNMTTRVLFLLAADGKIVRGRPRGSWISSQYRWSPVEVWLSGGLPDVPVADAQVELVRRWLAAFGPGTRRDLQWWTGLTAGAIARALKGLDTAEVDLDGERGVVLASDVEPVRAPEPYVALLPALDPTPMGWNARGWFLGDYAAALFDRSGNIGPTIWCDGRIVGGWAQRRSGEIAVRVFEDIGAEAQARVATAGADLQRLIGAVRVTPRFRTPLVRELGGS
jgi:hypothetical protein